MVGFLGIIMDGPASLLTSLVGLSIVPTFDQPWLSSSLADFWGRRWNVTTSSVLRTVVYDVVVEGTLEGKLLRCKPMWPILIYMAHACRHGVRTPLGIRKSRLTFLLGKYDLWTFYIVLCAGSLVRAPEPHVSHSSKTATQSAHGNPHGSVNSGNGSSTGVAAAAAHQANGSTSNASSHLNCQAPGSDGKPRVSEWRRALGMCLTFLASGLAHECIITMLQV